MSSGDASQHLTRALRLLVGVEEKTAALQQHASQFIAEGQGDTPFVAGMVSAFKGRKILESEKGALITDLDLAWSEVEKAEQLDPNESISVEGAEVHGLGLNVAILGQRGVVEVAWGGTAAARQHFERALELGELAEIHFWLGCLDESDHRPQDALEHFERCLELEPDGELSVDALRAAEQMRSYKKKFRGSWMLVGCLGLVGIMFFLQGLAFWAGAGGNVSENIAGGCFGVVVAGGLLGGLYWYWSARWK